MALTWPRPWPHEVQGSSLLYPSVVAANAALSVCPLRQGTSGKREKGLAPHSARRYRKRNAAEACGRLSTITSTMSVIKVTVP